MTKFKARFTFGLLVATGILLWAFSKFGHKDVINSEGGKQNLGSVIFMNWKQENMQQAVAKAAAAKTAVNITFEGRGAPAPLLKPARVGNHNTSFFLDQLGNSRPFSESNFSVSVIPRNYLRFINSLHDELSLGSVHEHTKRQLEDMIRSGHGLEPYVTERGEAALIENGIVYRPWRRPDPSTMHKKYPSPYTTEYELYMPFNEDLFFEGRNADQRYKTQRKIILWHTATRYVEPKEDLQPLKGCPDFPCYITTNKSYSENSSAMLFAAQILESGPPKRRPDQIFILHNHEPPYVNEFFKTHWRDGFKQPGWKQAFNWTMTYRMDSDLIAPYGFVRRRPTPIVNKDYKGIVANKTKLVAWIVSNCKASSQREVYVDELRKYISIDIFGHCGKLKCPHQDDWKCAKMISEEYKFYIGFESAFCPDYISEKTFHYLTMDTITLARGSDEYFQHLPNEIYINTANFPSPKALAERLLYLHNNAEAYIEMLREKDKYMSNVEGFPVREDDGHIRFVAYRQDSPAVCLACMRLWNLDKYAKSVPDIHKWFDSKMCRKAQDLNF